MAMFDRRLLAYFDDASIGMSRGTLQDRTVEYQRYLSEIEHELGKYQRLLGKQRVKLRARNREGWIGTHRTDTSVRARCAHLAPQHDRSEPSSSRSGPATSRTHADVAPKSPHGLDLAREGASPDVRTAGQHQGIAGQHHGTAGQHQGSVAHAQASAAVPAAADTEAVEREDGASHAPDTALATTWAQLDSLIGLPRSSSASRYVICGGWEGHEPQATEDRKAREAADRTTEECTVRQQFRLAGGVGGRWVLLEVIRRGPQGDEFMGSCRLDALDERNHEVRAHVLRDDSGEDTGASCRLRLHVPEGSGSAASRVPGAVCQDPRALPRSAQVSSLAQERELGVVGGSASLPGVSESGAELESADEENEEETDEAEGDGAEAEELEEEEDEEEEEEAEEEADIGDSSDRELSFEDGAAD